MSTLTAIAPTVKPTITIVIKGTLYDVEPIPAGESGLAAVRLTKRSLEGETYDVVLTEDGRAECDCPSYEFTYRGTSGTCKHGTACLIHGLLPVAPAAAPAPRPAVAPVTPADVKRARAFGLTIPAAPVVNPVAAPAEVAPAGRTPTPAQARQLETLRQRCEARRAASALRGPVDADEDFELNPAPVAIDLGTTTTTVAAPASAPMVKTTSIRNADRREMTEWLNIHWTARQAAPVAEVNPRDSWTAWTDADTWTTEAPDFVAEPIPSDEIIDVGLTDLIHDAHRLRREIMLSPVAGSVAVGLASDDEAACPVAEDDHRAREARQGRRAARFAPSIEDEAYASGFYLQFHHGLPVDPPAEWPPMRSSAFRLGQADGLLARIRREDEEHAAWAEERERDAFGEPGDDWHEAERVRAVGALAARLA